MFCVRRGSDTYFVVSRYSPALKDNNDVVCAKATVHANATREQETGVLAIMDKFNPVHVEYYAYANCDTAAGAACAVSPVRPRCTPGGMNSYLQMAAVNRCFEVAAHYAARAGFAYTHYVRARPDMVVGAPPPAWAWTDSSRVVTAAKRDAPGNDQMWIMSAALLDSWWRKLDMRCGGFGDCCPEYTIFKGVKVVQTSEMHTLLVRRRDRAECWDPTDTVACGGGGKEAVLARVRENGGRDVECVHSEHPPTFAAAAGAAPKGLP